jgi:sortase B
MNKKNNRLLFNILSSAAVICVLIGGLLWYKTRSGSDVYAEIQKSTIEETAEPAESPASAESPVEKAAEVVTAVTAEAAQTSATSAPQEEIPIDFATLWETCPDAYAWIRIPNTQVDYPVCQMVEGDQSFYLNHRADKVAEFAGSIYSENYNKRDFTDPVTVLYGHDMSNGSMFQNLHLYEDRAFFEKNKDVIVYLPDRVLHYKIFAAYNYDDRHLLLANDNFTDPFVLDKFQQEILAQQSMTGFVDQNTVLNKDSHILTLSTCNAYDDQRYLVQCLLMNPEVLPKTDSAAQGGTSAEAQTGR